MNKASRSPGLFGRFRAPPAPDSVDAADLGTAFGLEVSLDQTEHDAPGSAPLTWQAPAWVQRLTSRGKGGA